MKSREQHIEFDQNYCEHYAPKPGSLKSDYCALGCGALERMSDASKAGETGPCIGGHKAKDVLALCPKWQRRSMERSIARADACGAEDPSKASYIPYFATAKQRAEAFIRATNP